MHVSSEIKSIVTESPIFPIIVVELKNKVA